MGLIDYIRGKRYGEDANKLERESMEDPFLQEALDGYDSVLSNHINSIERLQGQISHQSKAIKKHKIVFYSSIAAAVAIVIGVGSVFIFTPSNEPLMAERIEEEVSVPENEVVIDNVLIDQPKEENKAEVVDNEVAEDKKEIVIDEIEKDEATKEIPKAEKKVIKKESEIIVDEEVAIAEVVLGEIEEPLVSSDRLAEVANEGKSVRAKAAMATDVSAAPKSAAKEGYLLGSTSPPQSFEKGEFKDYFSSNARKIDEENKVEVEFVIGENNQPTSIVIKEASSDAAKKEALRVIKNSPIWTEDAGKEIKLKLEW